MKIEFNQEIRDRLLEGIGKNGKYMINREYFETLYVKEKYPISHIAAMAGLSHTVLRTYRKEIGISDPNKKKPRVADVITEEIANKLYIEGEMTVAEIAIKYGLSHGSVRDRLKELGLYEPYRNYNKTSATKTYKEYLRTGAVNRKESKDSASKIESTVLRGSVKCPVCGKEFYPAPYHQWKSLQGSKVCSYSCSLKSGAKYWGVNTEFCVDEESEG